MRIIRFRQAGVRPQLQCCNIIRRMAGASATWGHDPRTFYNRDVDPPEISRFPLTVAVDRRRRLPQCHRQFMIDLSWSGGGESLTTVWEILVQSSLVNIFDGDFHGAKMEHQLPLYMTYHTCNYVPFEREFGFIVKSNLIPYLYSYLTAS